MPLGQRREPATIDYFGRPKNRSTFVFLGRAKIYASHQTMGMEVVVVVEE
jgi:hypothetical protein